MHGAAAVGGCGVKGQAKDMRLGFGQAMGQAKNPAARLGCRVRIKTVHACRIAGSRGIGGIYEVRNPLPGICTSEIFSKVSGASSFHAVQPMEAISTASLLERWRDGETDAFAALIQRFEEPLLRHVRVLLGPNGSCEDVVQETFLRLAQKPPAPHPDANQNPSVGHGALAAWLHRVARNLCTDEMRSTSRRKQREQAVAPAEAVSGGQSSVDGADTRAAVRRGMDQLPPEQREVLVLRLLDGHSYQEIAEITGRKTGTIGWLLSTGLVALSQILAPMMGHTQSSQVRLGDVR
ncbi:MAG TPA: RNA polymerase sigma factor [Planctomycetes bacterium]|nr:RNA polymerase sigma factor [Planctomycetota bacterium]